MWCAKCKFGSEVCKFRQVEAKIIKIPAGDTGRFRDVAVAVHACPQCGFESYEHFQTRPFASSKPSPPRKRTKQEIEDEGDALHQEIAERTGPVRALDYTRYK